MEKTEHGFLGWWADEIVPLIYVENISKNEKNLCTNKWQITTFLDHGLTNFVPTFLQKKIISKNWEIFM
jgi:hypothetical protein